MEKSAWLWDVKTTETEAKKILRDPEHKRFAHYAARLLAQHNTPKYIFREYLSKENFCRHWPKIKRQMRKDSWNDPRIIFWNAVYQFLIKKFREQGVTFRLPKEKPPENSLQMKIAGEVRKIRIAKGMTQAGLAKRMGVSQQVVSRIEKGYENSSLSTLGKIAEHLGCDIEFNLKHYIPLESLAEIKSKLGR